MQSEKDTWCSYCQGEIQAGETLSRVGKYQKTLCLGCARDWHYADAMETTQPTEERNDGWKP